MPFNLIDSMKAVQQNTNVTKTEFQSPEHKQAFVKWAQKQYPTKNFEQYWDKSKAGGVAPTYEEFWNAVNQYNYNYDRKANGQAEVAFRDPAHNPYQFQAADNELYSKYVKANGQPRQLQDFLTYRNQQKWAKDYASTVEDQANKAAGKAPMKQQINDQVDRELAQFRQYASSMPAGTPMTEYQKLFDSLPTLKSLTDRANAITAAAAAKEAAQKAAEEEARSNGKVIIPKVPAYTNIEGTKLASTDKDIDLAYLKSIGYNEKNGFQGLMDAVNAWHAQYRAAPAAPAGTTTGNVLDTYSDIGRTAGMPQAAPIGGLRAAPIAPAGTNQENILDTYANIGAQAGKNNNASFLDNISQAYGKQGQNSAVQGASDIAFGGGGYGWVPDSLKNTTSGSLMALDIPGAATRLLQTPQATLMNATNAAASAVTGKPFAFNPNMTLADWSKTMSTITGGKDTMAEIGKVPVIGAIANFSLEVLSDPMSWVSGGVVFDILKAKGLANPNSIQYAKAFVNEQLAAQKEAATVAPTLQAAEIGNKEPAAVKTLGEAAPIGGTAPEAATAQSLAPISEWEKGGSATWPQYVSPDGRFRIIEQKTAKGSLFTVEDSSTALNGGTKEIGTFKSMDEALSSANEAVSHGSAPKPIMPEAAPIVSEPKQFVRAPQKEKLQIDSALLGKHHDQPFLVTTRKADKVIETKGFGTLEEAKAYAAEDANRTAYKTTTTTGYSWVIEKENPKYIAPEAATSPSDQLIRSVGKDTTMPAQTTSDAVANTTEGAAAAMPEASPISGSSMGIIDPRFDETTNALVKAWRNGRAKFVYGQESWQRVSKIQAKSLGKNAVNIEERMQTARNASSEAQHVMEHGVTNLAGEKYGSGLSLKEIAESVPKGKEEVAQDYLLNMHNVDRMGFVRKAGEKLHNFEMANPHIAEMSTQKLNALAKSTAQNPDILLAREYLDLVDEAKAAKDIPVMPSLNDPKVPRSASESEAIAKQIETAEPWVKDYAAKTYKYYEDLMKGNMVGGLLSSQEYAKLQQIYPHYMNTSRVDYAELKGGIGGGSGNGIAPAKVVKKATGATSEVVNHLDTMAMKTMQIKKAARNNQLYLDIIKWAKQSPDEAKTFVRYIDPNEAPDIFVTGKNGVPLESVVDAVDEMGIKELRKGVYGLTAYENGEAVHATLTKQGYDQLKWLKGDYGELTNKAIEFGHKFTNPIKTLATGINPYFMGPNVARDISSGIINSEKLDPSGATYLVSVADAAKQMATKSENWKHFEALGGTHASFYEQNKGFANSLKPGLKATLKAKDIGGVLPAAGRSAVRAVEGAAQSTEGVNRFAAYLDGIKRYGDTPAGRTKAMYLAAENTTNFSKTAPYTRLVDSFVAYLNPAVQGLDKVVRQTLTHPFKTLAKGAISITAPTAILYAINKGNPHYKDLDNRTKDINYNIPNVFGEKDAKGYCTTFIAIPKNREFGTAFGAAVERVMRVAAGEKEPFKGLGETVKTQFLPPSLPEGNVTSPLTFSIPANKDFAGRPIVPENLSGLSPKNQYNANTSELAKRIGAALNYSPMKIDYLIKSYGGGLAKMALPAFVGKDAATGDKAYRALVKPWLNLIIKDPVFLNQPTTDFYDLLDKATAAANDRNKEQNIDSGANTPDDRKRSSLAETSKSLSEFRKQEQALADSDLSTQEREKQVKALRKQAIDLAKQAISDYDNGTGSKTIYPDGVDDQKREEYDKILAKGVPETKLQAVFAKFKTLTPKKGHEVVTASDRKMALYAMYKNGQLTETEWRTILTNYYPAT